MPSWLIYLLVLFPFVAFQTSACFQYSVNSESEDSEQETENESLTGPKVTFIVFIDTCMYVS